MKKLRVFPTVKKKRIVSGFLMGSPGAILLFCLLIPYLVTSFFGNIKGVQQEEKEAVEVISMGKSLMLGDEYVSNQTSIGQERIPLELYVADVLARTMEENYELEALKAQAVLIRSNLYFQREQENSAVTGIPGIYLEDEMYGRAKISDKIRQAVLQTRGVYLTYQDRAAVAPYFQVSNGATRNAGEIGMEEYSYLESVVCKRDFLSEDFISVARVTTKKMESLWEQMPGCQVQEEVLQKLKQERNRTSELELYRDSTGYVLYVKSGEKCVTGEDFRDCLQLSSAGFHLEGEGGEIKISCKGVGHGLGMSQFGANQMALEGKSYIDILEYFFRNTTITKTE